MLDIVEIRWTDSIGSDGGWKPLADLLSENVDRYLVHRSVGYLADETPESILLVTSLQELIGDEGREQDRNVQGGVRIPKIAILERYLLDRATIHGDGDLERPEGDT